MSRIIDRSGLARSLAEGGLLFGVWCLAGSSAMVEIAGASGLDFVLIDAEHAERDSTSELTGLCRAADAVGIAPFIRVSSNSAEYIGKALDAGACGVVVPRVQNAHEVKQAVAAMHYPLSGRRGACPLVRANAYSAGQQTWTEYVETTRRHSVLCVLIEDPVGVSNIEEILGVDGLSAVSFGAFDMSMESGDLGAASDQVAEAELRIRAACLAHQVPFMNAVPFAPDTSSDEFVRYREEGGRFAIVGNDLGIWARHCLAGQDVRATVRAKLDCASAKHE